MVLFTLKASMLMYVIFPWTNVHGMKTMLDTALWFWGQAKSPEPAECQEKVKFGGVSPWLGS